MSGTVKRLNTIWLTGILATGACASVEPSETTLPALAVRLEAPSQFRAWFTRTEACSGLTASFETVEWYVVPGVDSFLMDGESRVGMWQRVAGRSQIVVAGNYVNHEMVVSHEILHHLLGREGHPNGLFADRCQLTWETWSAKTTQGLASNR